MRAPQPPDHSLYIFELQQLFRKQSQMVRLEGSANSTGIFWSDCKVRDKCAGCVDYEKCTRNPSWVERKDRKANAGKDC